MCFLQFWEGIPVGLSLIHIFYGSGAYSLRRIDPQQTEKDTCTYCNQRTGYDYEIIPKNR